eukprot:4469537-Prymnesium_polylepis.1
MIDPWDDVGEGGPTIHQNSARMPGVGLSVRIVLFLFLFFDTNTPSRMRSRILRANDKWNFM